MSTSSQTRELSPQQRLDRPSASIPSVDRPWDDPEDRAHRLGVIRGDRSAHRRHHALYEDMLN